jgi:hypothetical protein
VTSENANAVSGPLAHSFSRAALSERPTNRPEQQLTVARAFVFPYPKQFALP